MRKVLFIILISISTLLIVTSCEKDAVNVKYPRFKEKVVVAGYITTDKPYQYINLSRNMKVYGNWYISPNPVQKITVSDGSLEVQLDTSRLGFVIRSSEIQIEEGKTYTLRIWNSSGLCAEASCTVPFKRSFNLKIDTAGLSNRSQSYKYYSINVGFTDIAGEENNYRLVGYQVSYSSGPKYLTNVSELRSDEEFLDDKGRDGLRYNIKLGTLGVFQNMDSLLLKVYLLNLDKPYYNFYKSIRNYSSGEDPFTESAPVYTNIKGGLGVFASYTIDSLILRMK